MCSTVLLIKRGILQSSWCFCGTESPYPPWNEHLQHAPACGSFWVKMPIFRGKLFVWGSVYFGCRAPVKSSNNSGLFCEGLVEKGKSPSWQYDPKTHQGRKIYKYIFHFGQGGKMISFFPWVGYVIFERRVYVNLVWNFKNLFYPVVCWWNHLRINH